MVMYLKMIDLLTMKRKDDFAISACLNKTFSIDDGLILNGGSRMSH